MQAARFPGYEVRRTYINLRILTYDINKDGKKS
jgi:hypothetical protein